MDTIKRIKAERFEDEGVGEELYSSEHRETQIGTETKCSSSRADNVSLLELGFTPCFVPDNVSLRPKKLVMRDDELDSVPPPLRRQASARNASSTGAEFASYTTTIDSSKRTRSCTKPKNSNHKTPSRTQVNPQVSAGVQPAPHQHVDLRFVPAEETQPARTLTPPRYSKADTKVRRHEESKQVPFYRPSQEVDGTLWNTRRQYNESSDAAIRNTSRAASETHDATSSKTRIGCTELEYSCNKGPIPTRGDSQISAGVKPAPDHQMELRHDPAEEMPVTQPSRTLTPPRYSKADAETKKDEAGEQHIPLDRSPQEVDGIMKKARRRHLVGFAGEEMPTSQSARSLTRPRPKHHYSIAETDIQKDDNGQQSTTGGSSNEVDGIMKKSKRQYHERFVALFSSSNNYTLTKETSKRNNATVQEYCLPASFENDSDGSFTIGDSFSSIAGSGRTHLGSSKRMRTREGGAHLVYPSSVSGRSGSYSSSTRHDSLSTLGSGEQLRSHHSAEVDQEHANAFPGPGAFRVSGQLESMLLEYAEDHTEDDSQSLATLDMGEIGEGDVNPIAAILAPATEPSSNLLAVQGTVAKPNPSHRTRNWRSRFPCLFGFVLLIMAIALAVIMTTIRQNRIQSFQATTDDSDSAIPSMMPSPPPSVAPSLVPSQSARPTAVRSAIPSSSPTIVCRWPDEFRGCDGSFAGEGLGSSIPTTIGLATHLTFLDLSYNAFTGTIPTEIGLLTLLTYLDLSRNHLTGSIPMDLMGLSVLKTLYLHENSIAGSIPTQVARLTDLLELDLSINRMTGLIPTELAVLPVLDALTLYDNDFNGTCPEEVVQKVRLLQCGK